MKTMRSKSRVRCQQATESLAKAIATHRQGLVGTKRLATGEWLPQLSRIAPWELNSVTSVPYFVTRSNRWPVRGLIPQESAGMASKAIGGWPFDVLPSAARSPG